LNETRHVLQVEGEKILGGISLVMGHFFFLSQLSLLQNDLLPKLFVMLKILSSEYQLYACGKIFRMPRFWDENFHFAKGSG
jgi:hypothetical protein